MEPTHHLDRVDEVIIGDDTKPDESVHHDDLGPVSSRLRPLSKQRAGTPDCVQSLRETLATDVEVRARLASGAHRSRAR